VDPVDDDRSQDPGAGGPGLLRSKTEVEWRAATGEEFSSEDVKEQVVFASFFERGLNLHAGDFFRGLLYYYRLELVHLVPNSITVVSMFINFCEAYLGIPPHFTLWRYFFCVKSTGKRSGPVGTVMFLLRTGLKAEWIDTTSLTTLLGGGRSGSTLRIRFQVFRGELAISQ
jgi:hypothetical protein